MVPALGTDDPYCILVSTVSLPNAEFGSHKTHTHAHTHTQLTGKANQSPDFSKANACYQITVYVNEVVFKNAYVVIYFAVCKIMESMAWLSGNVKAGRLYSWQNT